jgi:enoyl-CoA hydratase
MADLVTYEVSEKIAYLTLNRPDHLNALNLQMFEALSSVISRLEADEDARVAILRGAGRALCAGMDLSVSGQAKFVAEGSLWSDRERLRRQIEVWKQVWRCPKPIVLQAHGYCMAGGVLLLIVSDLVVMADNCVIGWPRLPLGGGLLGPPFAALFGARRAKQMDLIVGSRLSAQTALEWGVANEIVPAEALDTRAREIARDIAKAPPTLLALHKASLNRASERAGFIDTLEACAEWDALAHADPGAAKARKLLSELGLKGAIEEFEANGI